VIWLYADLRQVLRSLAGCGSPTARRHACRPVRVVRWEGRDGCGGEGRGRRHGGEVQVDILGNPYPNELMISCDTGAAEWQQSGIVDTEMRGTMFSRYFNDDADSVCDEIG
jgi:hypothetical protein